ncbi:MAG: sulfite exporter TauE/SafE family protein [Syntrophomonas sp.]|uniref:sulfite exporter TauE/SafE family protein n=1 Tax=Syntrophomonas sp. TaxID=2053627 RepID=UPI0026399B90|nr:sulfite exporter TauE/SafE family protein [Syntrophomonas sp.]MDD2510340.1 sulfite exporter TauE/SafE family protein [Syntrophomonas sp.]MDD4627493.1 sulfite exporter TauE/SafE family protein [Syntrophomonas sp.]
MDRKIFMDKYAFIAGLLFVIILALAWVLWSRSPLAAGAALPRPGALELFLLTAIGIMAGYFGGLLGIGGGIIMLPLLKFGFNYSTTLAVGTTLFAVIFTAISGGYAHFLRGNAHRAGIVYISMGGIAGILLGSFFFQLLAEQMKLLNLVLGLFFVFPGFFMIWESLFSRKNDPIKETQNIRERPLGLCALGFVVGFLTGILGLGGGYLLVPGMTYFFGYPIYLAVGTSLVSVIPVTIIGGSIKLLQSYVLLEASLALAAGTIIGAQLGAASIRNYKPATLKFIFGLYFSYAAIRLISSFWF